ncbi:MAG: hypothetical protein QGG40_05895, partial [Myxococcota bacterium]|nr:hypothetical protein [Myxococcota bacterium]
GAALHLRDFTGACGQAILRRNLRAAGPFLPAAAWWPLLLPVFALLPNPRRRSRAPPDPSDPNGAWTGWTATFLTLPILSLVPTFSLVAVQHRYLFPIAPAACVLLAGGVLRLAQWASVPLARAAPRWQTRLEYGLPIALLSWLAVTSAKNPHSLYLRLLVDTEGDAQYTSVLRAASRAPGIIGELVDFLQAEVPDRAVVEDCAELNLAHFLSPHPVRYGHISPDLLEKNPLASARAEEWSRACNQRITQGPTSDALTWIVIEGDPVMAGTRVSPRWRMVERFIDVPPWATDPQDGLLYQVWASIRDPQ